MNTAATVIARPTMPSGVSLADRATAELDQLMQEYLMISADALDVMVALYDAAENGTPVPAEASAFVARLGAWEGGFQRVLLALDAPASRPLAPRMSVV